MILFNSWSLLLLSANFLFAPFPLAAQPIYPNSGGTLDCSFQEDIQLQDDLILRQVVNQNDLTLSVQMEYAGQGWLGFAFSPTGEMIGSTAIIGITLVFTILEQKWWIP
jgi:hypothetical protein